MKHDIRDYLSVFQYRRFLRSDWVEVLNLFCMLTFPLRHGTFCAIDLHMVCRDHGNLESLRDGIPFGRVVLQHLRQQPESKVSSTPELCWGLQDSKSNSQKSGFQVQMTIFFQKPIWDNSTDFWFRLLCSFDRTSPELDWMCRGLRCSIVGAPFASVLSPTWHWNPFAWFCGSSCCWPRVVAFVRRSEDSTSRC